MFAVQTKRVRTGPSYRWCVGTHRASLGPPVSGPTHGGVGCPDSRRSRSGGLGETVTTNVDIVRAASNAVATGDGLALMGLLSRDVQLTVGAGQPDAAPWFGVYHGKRGVLQFLEQLATIGPVEITDKALVADGDLVVAWIHIAFSGPNGRAVDMDEAHFWRLVDGKIVSIDYLVDTAAVAAAFT